MAVNDRPAGTPDRRSNRNRLAAMRSRYTKHPGPRAIDPISGFDVPWEDLVRQYDGEMVYRRFVDKQNPQDFVRPIPERIALPYARPEPPETYIAQNLLWEDGLTPILGEGDTAILEEGLVVTL